MSSIIVLDSSDEDESPPKKTSLKASPETGNHSPLVTNASKNQNSKQRLIPSGITITPRLSPTTLGAKGINMPPLNASPFAASYPALNSMINNERQTPTPPKAQTTAGTFNQRKRKTPTPPQPMPRLTAKNYKTMTNSSPAKAATTVAPLPPIMPMITSVHSMAAAGATPPLQLMATPPHNLGAFMGLNEQLMINPHLMPTSLPHNTTITAHPNPNQNNINNNFKIHLPFNKPSTTTPSPAASPASSAPKTPSPQLTPSPQPLRSDKNARRIKPTTLLKSCDESWQRHKQFSQNDKQSQRTPISLNKDVLIEMLPPSKESPKSLSASSSRHHTPMTSPTTPKSQKSPDVIMLTAPTDHQQTPTSRKDCGAVLDLTHSPNKVTNSHIPEIVDLVNTPEKPRQQTNGEANNVKPDKKPDKPPPKPPLEPEYEELIKACRKADPSKDMEKLIKSKLIKYYYEVHSDFVKSKSFRKNIRKVVESIKAKPDLVYFNLKTIVEELKVRRKVRMVEETASAAANAATTASVKEESNSKESLSAETNSTEKSVKNTTTSETDNPATSTSSAAAEISATASTSTGNKKLDEQIRKLNKALYVLTKRIEVLEQAEVDWDDDDSSFLQVERFKKRACQIYEKICDLTGESKNAHRLVKKPIKFNETRIPQFNKTLQAFINRTREFPDYYDVLRMLEHCNRTYSLGLVNFEIKNIAEDAFIKVGKLLQSRRKADLYETVTHFAGDGKDPAKTDPALAAKLNENLKIHKKINDILEKFSRKQDMPEDEEEDKVEKTEDNSTEVAVKREIGTTESATSESICKEDEKGDVKNVNLIKTEEVTQETQPAGQVKMDVDNVEEEEEAEYDEDDEEDEDEDDENIDEQVECLANGDVSDNESDNEDIITKDQENSNKDTSVISLNDSMELIKNTNESKLSAEFLDVPKNSRELFLNQNTMENCIDKESSIKKCNSETASLLINNNNLDISTTTTKTVINVNTTKDSTTRPLSPPIPLASLIPTRNGKLKDIPPYQLLNNENTTILSTSTNPSIINAATATTTTTADLKIVHVSSLEPDLGSNDRNEVGGKLKSSNKSLEEIVISDEES